MRQIKFRVWNNTGKRMLYDSSLAFRGNAVVEEAGTKVMQFIGLLDKNKKEIYEGDIVKDTEGLKAYIKYYECGFNTCVEDKDGSIIQELHETMDLNDNKNLVIIGNIHENPGLAGNKEDV